MISPRISRGSGQSYSRAAAAAAGEEVLEQPDLLDSWQPVGTAAQAVVRAYTGGIMPIELVHAVHHKRRAKLMTIGDVALRVRVSRPQLSNALHQRFGLSWDGQRTCRSGWWYDERDTERGGRAALQADARQDGGYEPLQRAQRAAAACPHKVAKGKAGVSTCPDHPDLGAGTVNLMNALGTASERHRAPR
ncbi:hypothetical protein [Methylorubrum extorquens]